MLTLLRKAAFIFGFSLFVVGALSAQQLATLNVTVVDQSGGVIPNAQVTIQSTDTGGKRSDKTNSDGLASLPGLQAGSYKLVVSAAGFGEYRENLTLAVGQTASVSAVLALGAMNEQI